MNRLTWSFLVAVLAACGDGDSDTSEPEPRLAPPTRGAGQATVVVVVIDSARADHFTPYGYALDTTPTLAAVAAEGTVFEQCITPCTGTNGGLASLLTGQLASEHGVGSIKETGRHRLPDEAETLAEKFRAQGFRTFAAVGLPQLGPLSGFDQGFDTYRAPHPRGDQRNAQQVFLDARPGLDALLADDAPAFVMLQFADARSRGAAPAPAGTRFVEAHLRPFGGEVAELGGLLDRLPDDPDGALKDLRQKLGRARGSDAYIALGAATYDGRLAFVDEQIAALVELLAARGRWDDALFAVVSTRGAVLTPPRSTGGPAFLPELVHVPLIVRAPRAGSYAADGLVQSHDLHATLARIYGFDGPEGPRLFAEPDRVVAYVEDATFARRAVFGLDDFVEEDGRNPVVFDRSGAFVPRPDELEGARAQHVEALKRALAAWTRPWARVVIEAGHEDDDAELEVHWRLFDGFTRSALLSGRPLRDLRTSALNGAATLAGGQRLELETSRRDAPARLGLRWLGHTIDETQVFLGDRPLAELFVPRVPIGNDVWPADTPADVDLKRHAGSWWKLSVGAEGEAGRAVEVLFTVCPPPAPSADPMWTLGGAVRAEPVAGREDAVRLFGVTPFEVDLQRKPKQELALAVAIEGRIVPASEMRASGNRFAPQSEIDLYLPDWLSGVTESFAAEGPPPQAGSVRIRRGTPGAHTAASDAELELLQRLMGDE